MGGRYLSSPTIAQQLHHVRVVILVVQTERVHHQIHAEPKRLFPLVLPPGHHGQRKSAERQPGKRASQIVAGSGRSAVVATDSLWTWAFPATAAETTRDRSRTEYHRLLDQLMAWLLRDPEVDALRVDAPGDPVPFGTPVRLQVTAVGAAGEPLAGVTVQVAVEPMAQVPGPAVPRQPWPEPTDVRGAVTLQISDLTPGPHRLVVEALIGGRVEQATAPLVVLPPSGEASLIQPSDALLRSLAKASGGQVWQARAPAEGVPMGLRDGLDFADGVYTDLWSRPEVLLWLVALMGLEWALRRRWGLA